MKKLMSIFSIVLLLCMSSSLIFSGCNLGKSESVEFPQGVWMWGNVLSDVGVKDVVDKLVENNIHQVYFLVKGTAGKKTSAEKLTEFITQAHAEKIKVHLWYIVSDDDVYMAANPQAGIYHCPNPSVSARPYPINNNKVNLLYPPYKEYVLENIRYFITNFDCDGIHLDCIRYSHFVYSFDPYSLQKAASLGCDTIRLLGFFDTEPNYTNYVTNKGFVNLYTDGDPDVVKWVEMRKNVIYDYIEAIRRSIEQIKPGLELNAAFMPEGATDPAFSDVYYAQNYKLHSTILDMISPMIYFESFGKSTDWLQTITKGAKDLVDPQCEIYSGVQAFDGVTAEQLKEQIQYSFDGGAEGIIVFRYGTITDDSWEVLKNPDK
jgi:uncharacterized lipoprotein YddW (UPF0748 family)